MGLDHRLNHINEPEERLELAKILDLVDLANRRKVISFSHFLSPLIVSLAEPILKRCGDISYSVEGGYPEAERNMLAIYPDYHLGILDFPMCRLRMDVKSTSNQRITHRDYLGAILSLGISRDYLGDIVVLNDNSAIVVLSREIQPYVAMNLINIGRHLVFVEETSSIQGCATGYEDILCSLSSLRLDVVVANAFGTSRRQAESLIRSESVKVQWRTLSKPGAVVGMNSYISCRHYGRIKLMEVLSVSKKNKMKVMIRKFI